MKKTIALIAKKAMVYALAASMVIATPLTALAAEAPAEDYSDAFVEFEQQYLPSSTKSFTGTQTYTSTKSGTDTITETNTTSEVLHDEAVIVGIALSQYQINAEAGCDYVVEARILFDGDDKTNLTDAQKNALYKKIKWTTSNKEAVGIVYNGTRKNVTLRAKQGTKAPVEITASIDDFANDIHFKSGPCKVNVKEYTQSLTIVAPAKAYVKHVYDMTKDMVRVPATANDTITWYVSDAKVATITADGKLTCKKVGNTTVYAVTEKGAKGIAKVKVEAGVPATKVTIRKAADPQGTVVKTADIEAADAENTLTVAADMYIKKDGKEVPNDPSITDEITWSVKKAGVVEVITNADGTATIVPKAVGKAAVVAKATSGKSATLNVTVTAKLSKLEISNTKLDLYTGQTLQVEVSRVHPFNADKLKYSVDNAKVATIDGKGVLKATTKPLDGESATVTVTVMSAKDNKISATQKFTVKQSDVKAITITDPAKNIVARDGVTVAKPDKIKNVTKVQYVPKTVSYTAATVAAGQEDTLVWKSSTPKVATVDQCGNVTAVKGGKATITATGYALDKSGSKPKTIKVVATYKVQVKQPATSVSLKKPVMVVSVDTKNGNNKTAKEAKVGMTAVLNPKGAEKGIKWYGFAGATVDSATANKLTAKAIVPANTTTGTAFVYSAVAASGATATQCVLVAEKVKTVELKANGTVVPKTGLTVKVGQGVPVEAFVNGKLANAGDMTIETVTIAPKKAGTISIVNGVVYGLRAGKADIVVTTTSGKKTTFKAVVSE